MMRNHIVTMNFTLASAKGERKEIEKEVSTSKVKDIRLAIEEIIKKECGNKRICEDKCQFLNAIMEISDGEIFYESVEFKIPITVRSKVIFTVCGIIEG